MADYLLDTNILSIWYDAARPEHSKVIARVDAARTASGYMPRLFVSAVTLGEVEYGHRVATTQDPVKQAKYTKFIHTQCPEALDITRHVAEQYGQMKAWLFNTCSPRSNRSKAKRAEQLVFPASGRELGIDENDLWIAAQALTHNFVLVTHDRHGNFSKVLNQFASSLRVEDWAR